MLRIPSPLLALTGGVLLALLGHAQAADPAQVKDGRLVDARGMTLYTFAKDPTGQSVCNDACASNWPPLAARGDSVESDDWTLVERADGSWQWAYQGRPLYTFVQDRQPGDTLGDGRMGVWHVARPLAEGGAAEGEDIPR
ncbi:COG4315 family predicted lipoprotein [Pseudomonas oryzae]|uniref:Predicted lipoprotein with conserved Yx(FWY)xxD motif n=1 Tax=Pseudomonas oryzae TaxID=1392877 RepID=A0A1H1XFB5_9PSED|nr:hypothetical protein [Pseudomonas oryzae]SDT07928.1 Predicted lipoprotein with conserved Yx(FWY)xxD motif [Pseudomonas oryzae]